MAFDAGMVAAIAQECDRILTGARVERVQQPENDEITLLVHAGREDYRLLLSAAAAHPRFHITKTVKENPKAPPMFCMLLRKYLTGSRIVGVRQLGFERVAEFEFEACDPLGFTAGIFLYLEIMGKCSNIILADAQKKILGACRIIDFSTSAKRQILPGMTYELPPVQEKIDPTTLTIQDRERFYSMIHGETAVADEKSLTSRLLGVSPLVARELLCRAAGSDDALFGEVLRLGERIRAKDFSPVLLKKPDGAMLEYCYMPLVQYGALAVSTTSASFGELLDTFYTERDRAERMRQRSSDILRLLTNADTRLRKKIAAQRSDLASCADKERLRRAGDLITANIYKLSRGMEEVDLTDYYDETLPEVKLKLDPRLTPAQNAQKYYKKYNKSKSAEIALTRQVEIAEGELSYINTVFDAFRRASCESELDEIRAELYEEGFASKMKNYHKAKNAPKTKPSEYRTDGGYTVFIGKNNIQNDRLTFRLAEKNDWWFHVKNMPGSHAVMLVADSTDEPPERDFTQAAVLAATMSSAAEGKNVPVDYTRIRNIKKPPASKPGYVTYSTNYTAYVDPDPALAERLRVK